jgi:predicted site-specific integrase-resolvase
MDGQQRPLNTADAAERLKVTTRTIQRWCDAGKFPGAFRVGGQGSAWLIPVNAIVVIEDERSQTQIPDQPDHA